MEEIRIIEAEERYCASHEKTISGVAQEGLYLSNNTGFSLDAIRSFYHYCENMRYPQFYAVNSDDEAIGWCDIVPRDKTGPKIGYIGVGLRPEYREMGIGSRLMQAAMQAAKERGFTEIRLDCRSSNKRAIHLYRKLGFRVFAHKRRGLILDGEVIPTVMMKKKI